MRYNVTMIISTIKPNNFSLLDKKTKALVEKYMPSRDSLENMSTIFTAFADPGRLRIISALSVSEMCVGDLSSLLGINQTTLSHQLRFLKSANVVTYKKQGKVVFYSLTRPSVVDDFMLIACHLGNREWSETARANTQNM